MPESSILLHARKLYFIACQKTVFYSMPEKRILWHARKRDFLATGRTVEYGVQAMKCTSLVEYFEEWHNSSFLYYQLQSNLMSIFYMNWIRHIS